MRESMDTPSALSIPCLGGGPNTPPSFIPFDMTLFSARATSAQFMLIRILTFTLSTSSHRAFIFPQHGGCLQIATRGVPPFHPTSTPSFRAFKSITTRMSSATSFYDFKPLDSMFAFEYLLSQYRVPHTLRPIYPHPPFSFHSYPFSLSDFHL